MLCGRNAIFKWHEHHGKFMVNEKIPEVSIEICKFSCMDEQVFDIGYNTNHHQ
jgi:hypothetical protein